MIQFKYTNFAQNPVALHIDEIAASAANALA